MFERMVSALRSMQAKNVELENRLGELETISKNPVPNVGSSGPTSNPINQAVRIAHARVVRHHELRDGDVVTNHSCCAVRGKYRSFVDETDSFELISALASREIRVEYPITLPLPRVGSVVRVYWQRAHHTPGSLYTDTYCPTECESKPPWRPFTEGQIDYVCKVRGTVTKAFTLTGLPDDVLTLCREMDPNVSSTYSYYAADLYQGLSLEDLQAMGDNPENWITTDPYLTTLVKQTILAPNATVQNGTCAYVFTDDDGYYFINVPVWM